MLRIGTVRFIGKCPKHPNFQPDEGASAVKGGCKKCAALVEIAETHRRLARLISDYGPQWERKREPHPDDGRQMPLFAD